MFKIGWRKYQDEDFLVIGVHTPEFEFEKNRDNVIAAAQKLGLTFAIAQDNNHTTWNNVNNRYWPAKYLFDKEGKLRYIHLGEGSYDETESAIQGLIAVKKDMTTVAAPDFQSIKSKETYFGYWRSENFASDEGVKQDETMTYTFARSLESDQWDLQGNWTVAEQYIEAQQTGVRFRFRYNASKANLVMAVKDRSVQDVAIYLDGNVFPMTYLVNT